MEFILSADTRYGLEQARIQLPSIVADAHAGVRCIITKHGKPYAAIVPLEDVQRSLAEANLTSGLLALRGTGRGLWGADVGRSVSELRDEWGEV
jgi:prevent-host-death family protein